MSTNRIFDNTEIAFSLKSDSELERAYFLFKMISIEPLVKIGTAATNFAIKAHLPIEGLIRSTVFDHFCGGINEEDCLPVIDRMYEKGVSSVLDYSVEGKENENEFDSAMQKVLKIIDFAKNIDAIPIAVFKPSGLGRFSLYVKMSNGETLSENEQKEWNKILGRFDTICKTAKPIVYNTLQMYRHDRLDFLKAQHKKAKNENYYLGFKLVRGAYMEKENDRAEDKGYVSPICKNKLATDENFNNALVYMLDNLDEISLFAGTHNEESSYLLMQLMTEKGIKNSDKRVWFGQLYGMSDHISYNLADKGYNVAKYMPFGPVKDVMPYLIRRAEENTSVAGQTGRELTLLSKEKKRRKEL